MEPRAILDHLWKQFRELDEADLLQNESRMKAPWNPSTLIHSPFQQLQEGQVFAKKSVKTIGDDMLVLYAYGLVEQTGMFTRELAKWRRKTLTECTWGKFKSNFTINH